MDVSLSLRITNFADPCSAGNYWHNKKLKPAEVFFDLLAAAVGEEAAGLGGGRVGAGASGQWLGPARKTGAFERIPVES
jgi:hypothetical protein